MAEIEPQLFTQTPIVMKRFTLILSAIALTLSVGFAQTVTLTFTGRNTAGDYVQLNRVDIINLTQGWQETISWPDTTLTMQNVTGIDDVETQNFASLHLSQNNPNPFSGITDVLLTVADAGMVVLEIANANGRIVGTHRVSPQLGTHQFRVTLSAAGTYVMTARQNGKTSSIKMVNNGGGNGDGIEYTGIVEPVHAPALQPKSGTRGNTDNLFHLDDQMEYVGYAIVNGLEKESQHITQTQGNSQCFLLCFSAEDGEPCMGVPTLTDVDGNTYNTVQIGYQCWMKESLRAIHFSDSTEIPLCENLHSAHTNYENYTDPFRYEPGNDSANVAAYGYLYSWPAAMHGAAASEANPSNVQGICPSGWHVPSQAEWSQLFDYLRNHSEYWCGDDENAMYWIAKSLASMEGWCTDDGWCTIGHGPHYNNATNFSAMPAGYYGACNEDAMGLCSVFWSTTEENSNYAIRVVLSYATAAPDPFGGKKSHGFSVRCVKDPVK